MRKALFIFGIFLASPSASASSPSYVDFINDGQDPIISIRFATPGSADEVPVKLGEALEVGYVGHVTLSIDPDRGCLSDIGIEFASHKTLRVMGFNACRTHTLDISRAWRRRAQIKSSRFNLSVAESKHIGNAPASNVPVQRIMEFISA